VYKGVLRPHKDAPPSEGVRVAVKVIHPHVDEMVRMDMGILRGLAYMVSKWPKMEYLSLPETVEIFATNMIDQLDLRKEVRYAYPCVMLMSMLMSLLQAILYYTIVATTLYTIHIYVYIMLYISFIKFISI
jgi:hypothetical protein